MKKNLLHLILIAWSLATEAQSAYRIIYQTNDKYLNNILQKDDSVAYVYTAPGITNYTDYVKLIWNTPSSQYINNLKYIYSYNQLGSITETIVYQWDGTLWQPQSKTTRTYNAQNSLIEIITFSWSANNWNETNKSLYSYNIQGKLTSQIEQNSSNGQLTNYRKTSYVNDNFQRLIKDSTFLWINSSWGFTGMREFYYSVGSTLQDSSRQYIVTNPGNTLGEIYKTHFKYNSAGKEIERMEFYDYITPYSLLPYRHYTNLYDSKGNLIESGYKEITNGQWVDQRRTLSQYNVQNQLMERTFLQYKSSLGYVANNSRAVYAYAQDSSLIVIDGFSWVDDNWLPSGQTRIGYEPLQQQTGVDDLSIGTAKAFSNPFTTNTIIEFESVKATEASIRIYDFSGRLVFDASRYVISGTNAFSWEAKDKNGNTLPSGLYIVQIKTAEQLLTQKLVKQ